jgi:hypothetical protein
MQLEQYKIAQKRVLRRAQLWHASRLAVADYTEWRRAWPSIARAVAATLRREFST